RAENRSPEPVQDDELCFDAHAGGTIRWRLVGADRSAIGAIEFGNVGSLNGKAVFQRGLIQFRCPREGECRGGERGKRLSGGAFSVRREST
ncbi:MAG TPA: hypothetical protein DCE44_10575, partial [Verrucomicrobiales bacterium]|nr:hypothetical protein [Verrucomicrobiales bacterium]